MSDALARRVRSAAVAGWWTVLIGVIWLTAAWLVILGLLNAKPAWLLTLWGGGELTWEKVHSIMIWFIGTFKLILFVCVLTSIWLTLWARSLRSLRRGGE